MTSPGPAPDRLPAGHRVGSRYTVLSIIGEGATGVVYLAARDEDGQRVALKVIHRHLYGDRQIFGRYHREAAILKRLKGPHVVEMLDFIEEDGLLVIALEHIDGSSLEELLGKHAPIDVDRAVEIALQICSALEAAHAAGVVHRDLKPANVLIEPLDAPSPDGPAAPLAGRVRVVDFGLAKVVHGDQMTTGLTEQDMIFGTPEYMAPEQVRGEDADPRCDIYALGCILYEMTVGAVPFDKRTPIAVMTAHIAEQPPSPRSGGRAGRISAGLEAVILRALAKDPAERHPSARAFADALRACRERRVVGHAAADLDGAVSRTDLQLGKTALDHATPVHDEARPLDPGRPDAYRDSALVRERPATRLAVLEDSLDDAAAPGSRSRERLLWTVVAILFASAGIAIGALFGTR
ncbi:protein kinase [Sorangium cellulosum]|uniref:non-specific serine/threonine protein kinase n=1 Tax=Sorangium cellulosum TaxID=56 RepID=A0A4P2PTQ3_SORCE|nr:serine/threonine-protein kinase [Sorangium cellulosum]AUX20029.1 protein kinase [Sorangium cellulosum]